MKKHSTKHLFFLLVLLFQNSLFSQLGKQYDYNFKDNIQNITSKEYMILIQKNDGVYSLLDQNIYKSKKIKSLCISPLGNEILIVEENKIGLFKIGDQLEEIQKEVSKGGS